MPAQSDRVINLRVQATDDGATSTLTKIGKSANDSLNGNGAAGGGGGAGLLSQLKGGFGRGSAFTQSAKILQGGGAVLGLSLAGRELDALADKATQLRKELHDGSKSAAEVADELAKSIPVYGQIYEAGRKFRALIDGTADDLERLARENSLAKVLDGQAEALQRIKKLREEGDGAAQKVRDQRELTGQVDPGRSLARLGQERRDLEKELAGGRQKIAAEVGGKHAKSLAELQKAAQDAAARVGEDRENLATAREHGYAPGNLTDALQRDLAEKNATELALKREGLLKQQEIDAAAAASNKTLNEKLKLNDAQRAEVERAAQQARERTALEHETRMEEIRTKGKQGALKAAGKDVAAEIEGIQSGFRVEQAKLFQGFKEKFREALAGGPDKPLDVGKRFLEELFGRGKLKDQDVKQAVNAGLKKQIVEGAREALDAARDAIPKDPIDWLLRKAGLKGAKRPGDEARPQLPPGLAAALQVSEGSGAGARLAEQLGLQSSGSPQEQIAQNTQAAAKNTFDLHKVVTDLSSQVADLLAKLGVTPQSSTP